MDVFYLPHVVCQKLLLPLDLSVSLCRCAVSSTVATNAVAISHQFKLLKI